MPLPRMTTRRWMVVVAVVGLLMGVIIGAIRLKRRSDYLLSRAQYHAVMEEIGREWKRQEDDPSSPPRPVLMPEDPISIWDLGEQVHDGPRGWRRPVRHCPG